MDVAEGKTHGVETSRRLAVGCGCREQASRGRERESEADNSGVVITCAILGRGTRKNTTLTDVLGLPSEMTERETGEASVGQLGRFGKS